MNCKKQILTIVIILLSLLNVQAQPGGLFKKVKDNVTEEKTIASNSSTNVNIETTTQAYTNNSNVSNTEDNAVNDENTPKGYFLVNNPLGKITFSNEPFTKGTSGTKTVFNSNEFIYGRLQLNSGTIKDAFKIGNKGKDIPFHSLEYVVVIYKNGEKKYNNNQIWNNCLVKDADLSKSYFDFDVLPNPKNATTIISALADFSAGKSTAPLYSAINPQVFSEDGTYKVDVIIRHAVSDAWGKELEKEDWPTFEMDFDFVFNSNDIATLKKNKELASETANNNMTAAAAAVQELPKEWSSKSAALVMGFTQAQLVSMYQNSFTSKMDAHTVVKFHASSSSGGHTVVNNDYGIPVYRYSNQWYTIFIKYANGKTCYFQGFGLRQQYNGGGTYGKPMIDKNEYHMVDCEKMK